MIYKWQCQECGCTLDIERPIADCLLPPDTYCDCQCMNRPGPVWQRVYEAPLVARASFPDGYKRKGWTELKEAAKLQKVAHNSKPETRAEIRKEIIRMGIKPGSNE